MYKYTFIIPHHNNPDLLNRCIDSIPKRDDIQIVVVDDNSRDTLKPTVDRCGVEIVYIDKKSSKGAGRARNEGLKRAKGEWLLFPDCDDFYSQGFLSVLDEYSSSEIDVLYFSFNHLDGITGEPLPDLPFAFYFNEYDGSKKYSEEIRFHHNVPWTKMVKRDFINDNNISFEEVPNGNDILFSLRIGFNAKSVEVDTRKLYNYLKNENSILTKRPTLNENLCKIIHTMQLNQVYKALGHPEWCISTLSLIKSKFDKNDKMAFVSLLFTLLIKTPKILVSRNEWLKYFNKL